MDWEIREFHGSEYSTHRGTTHNSYLVKNERTALIDTVWSPFGAEFVGSLDKHFSLKDIDFIVAQHAEIDHSGGLAELMEKIPDTPVYCSKNGVKSLKRHFHKDWNFVPVKTGRGFIGCIQRHHTRQKRSRIQVKVSRGKLS